MPTEFMGRALQRQRDAVQRQMLDELRAIRTRLPAADQRGLSADAAAIARIAQLEEQVRILAGVVMEMYRPAVVRAEQPAAPRLVNRLAVFACPGCLAAIPRQSHLAGQRGGCPHCGSDFTYPW